MIIFEIIKHTKLISDRLKEFNKSVSIKLYTMNNMNQEKEVEKINTGEIIIATNLAGLGTDIKTDNIETNGGLHVIVTFLQNNQRVEEQAFGRTSREGKRGTGHMIINTTSVSLLSNLTPNLIKKSRNEYESKLLDEFCNKELKIIEIKDKLFFNFRNLMKKILEDFRKKYNNRLYIIQKIKDWKWPSNEESNLLLALEERWALFLSKIDNGELKIEAADEEYKLFENQIWNDNEKDEVIKNPFYHIAIANNKVINDFSLNDKYNYSLKHFNKALLLDCNFSESACVGRA